MEASEPPATTALDLLLGLTLALDADMERDLARRGLTGSRSHVVWLLAAGGPTTQRSVAAALEVSPRNVTGLVDGLVDTGFVTREPHPTDRRATLVTLTATGERVAAELRAEHAELAEQLFGDLPAERLDRLVEDLGGLLQRVGRLVADRPDG